MKTLDQLYAIHSKIKNIFLALGGAGVFVMMLYITVDVLVRNLSNTALIQAVRFLQPMQSGSGW